MKEEVIINKMETIETCPKTFVLEKPDYSKMYFEFQFKDGEKARYRMDKDCHDLQQFLDRMNHFHDLEKENKRLQEQLNEKGLWIGVLKSHLEECWEILKMYAEHDYLTPEDFYMRDRLENYYRRAGLGNIEDAKKLLETWGVK